MNNDEPKKAERRDGAMVVVTLRADAEYGHEGKQFVARLIGRDSKLTFKREFLGSKAGKRGGVTSAMVDTPGLYQTRDIDRKGAKDDTFYVLCPGGQLLVVEQEQAMAAANDLEAGREIDFVALRIVVHEERIADADGKDMAAVVTLKTIVGALQPGEYRRGEVIAARRAELALLRGDAPSAPPDVEALRAEAATLRSRLTEIDALLGKLEGLK